MKQTSQSGPDLNRGERAFAAAFLLILAAFFVLNLLSPVKEISVRENRHLEQFPVLSWLNVTGGGFMEDLETYISDQFVYRDAWVGLKNAAQLLLGRRDHNGVYYGRGGRLYAIPEIDEQIFYANLAALQNLAAKAGLPATVLPAPSAATIQPGALPAHARVIDEESCWQKAQDILASFAIVPSFEVLAAHAGEYLYYNSDHHWTTPGAYCAYVALMELWGLEACGLDEYEVGEAARDFLGALHSRTAYPFVKPDTVTLYKPEAAVTVRYHDSEMAAGALFEEERLAQKDKYAVFFGGNHARVTIKNSAGQGKLLVLKDSFANALVPLMAGQFEEIHMLDLRYYQGPVLEYLAAHEFTQILAVYNASSLGEQSFVSRLQAK